MWQFQVGLVGACIFLFWAYTVQVEQRVTAEIRSNSLEVTLNYQKATAEASQAHVDEINKLRGEHRKQTEAVNAELNRYRVLASDLAKADPKSFGDDYHIKLARVMCLIQAGPDNNSRQTCNNASPEAYLSNIAATITVTEERAEQWQELCEDGQESFCDWSITGFTPQTGITILQWLYRVDEYAKAQGDHIDGLHDLIKEISKDENNAK